MNKRSLPVITITLLSLAIAAPYVSVNGQNNYSAQGNLIVQVLYPNPPTPNWKNPQLYPVTFQIMKNGTVDLASEGTLTPIYDAVMVEVHITTVVTQFFLGSNHNYEATGSSYLNTPAGDNMTQTRYNPSIPTIDGQWQTIVCYIWDFGDDEFSTNQNPTHSYANEGKYTITLTVIDDDGLTDTAILTMPYIEIPEFSSWIILPFFLIATFSVIVIRKRLVKVA